MTKLQITNYDGRGLRVEVGGKPITNYQLLLANLSAIRMSVSYKSSRMDVNRYIQKFIIS
jgi:hypothetical protein